MEDWKQIRVDGNHFKWDSVFSKVIKHPKLEYEAGIEKKEIVVKTTHQVGSVEKIIKYKIIEEYQDDNQSTLSFFEKYDE